MISIVLTRLDLHYFTEENFVHVFRLSQLIIEYLLYVQHFLAAKRTSTEADVKAVLDDLDRCRAALIKRVC